MADNETIVAGIVIPSDSPFFLAVVGLHILVALVCVITGVVAMLSNKRPGQHPTFGTIYYWCLSAVFVSATVLSVIRWAEDYHLFVLGVLSFTAASLGRTARRRRWGNSVRLHIAGMGTSYVFLLIAFYVDNGKNLPRGASADNLLAVACCGRRVATHHARIIAASADMAEGT